MKEFLHKFGQRVMGVLSGFDRLLFRGMLRCVVDARGMNGHLFGAKVAMKDFKGYAQQVTEQLKEQSLKHPRELGCEIRYLENNQQSKKDLARQIAQRDGLRDGLICVLSAVEPCQTFHVRRCRQTQTIELEKRTGKCLHLYHDYDHPQFGLMHVRLQTWFPFTIQVWMNGREWLVKQLQRAGLDHARRDNCVCWVDDVDAAQQLLDAQLRSSWSTLLDDLRRVVQPGRQKVDGGRTRRRSFRALNPLNPDDIRLLTVVSKTEFVMNGLRNADVRLALEGADPTDGVERRRRSSRVSRQLGLLRAHGILQKVSKSHHYRVTDKGRQALTALLAAANATTNELTKLAA